MKKIILLSLLAIILAACSPTEVHDLNQFNNFNILKENLSLELEYGSDFDREALDFMLLREGLDLDYGEIDSHQIGEKNYSFSLDGKEYIVPITVVDTQGPIFSGSKDFTITEGEKLDLKTRITAKDPVDGNLEVSFTDFDKDKSGKQKVIATAKDKNGNSEEYEITITVKEKPKPVEIIESQTPSQNSNIVKTPSYVKGILIVNKKHPLPKSYNPGENPTAGKQFRALVADMQNQGYDISSSYSGFRSYNVQQGLFNRYLKTDSRANVEKYSARPGYSEHQTGLAFDLKHKNGKLVKNNKEVAWIKENAHRYGFIVRYPQDKTHITGYIYEPWHVRYIGDKAEEIYRSGLTLEEFLGVPGGNYN